MELRLVQKFARGNQSTDHGRSPKGETRIPVSSTHQHWGRLLRSILRYRSSDYRKELERQQTKIKSDNGTNISGAENELRENIEK